MSFEDEMPGMGPVGELASVIEIYRMRVKALI